MTILLDSLTALGALVLIIWTLLILIALIATFLSRSRAVCPVCGWRKRACRAANRAIAHAGARQLPPRGRTRTAAQGVVGTSPQTREVPLPPLGRVPRFGVFVPEEGA